MVAHLIQDIFDGLGNHDDVRRHLPRRRHRCGRRRRRPRHRHHQRRRRHRRRRRRIGSREARSLSWIVYRDRL